MFLYIFMGAIKTVRKGKEHISITKKQQQLANAVVKSMRESEGASKEELALRAGYSSQTARKNTQELFSAKGFQAALAEVGVTQNKIAKVLDDAMNAKTVATYQGEAYETDAPDHRTRLKAVDLAGDFTGLKQKNVNVHSVNVHVKDEDVQAILDVDFTDI